MYKEQGLPWFWEGHVQNRVADYLHANGWTIERTANTAKREQGVDVIAVRDTRRLYLEVKGYPEDKGKTNPSTQARHWYGQAFMGAVEHYRGDEGPELAIAFPNMQTYRTWRTKTELVLHTLGIGLYFVEADGTVCRVLDHERV